MLVGVKDVVGKLTALVGMLGDDAGSDLGKALISALRTLAPHAPSAREGLDQSHLMAMAANAPAVRSAPPTTMLGARPPGPSIVAGPRMPLQPLPTRGA